MDVVIFYGIYLFVAVLMAGAAVFITGGALHFGNKTRDGLLVYLFAPLIIVVALDPVLAGRNLSYGATALLASGESQAALVKWLQRLTSLFLLAVSVERVTYKLFRGGAICGYGPLMIAFGVCWICCVALPGAFGVRPVFSHENAYWLLIGLGLFATSSNGAETAIRVARNSLVLFAALGLVALLVKKSLVLEPYAGGLFSFFPWRYSGLAVGPNQMGPLALMLMICLLCYPFGRRWLTGFGWVVGLASLLLSQSKTAWLAAVVSLGSIALVRNRGQLAGWLQDRRYRFTTQVLLAMLVMIVVFAIFALGGGLLDTKIQKFLATRAGSDITSLTGRSEIWAAAWGTFLDSPIFGYGLAIWDPYFRMKVGLNVFHSHNQILSVLATSGFVGLLGFLAFVFVLFRQVWRNFAAYNGLIAGLSVVVLLRFISEVPLTFQSFASEALMPSLLFFAVAGASAHVAGNALKKGP